MTSTLTSPRAQAPAFRLPRGTRDRRPALAALALLLILAGALGAGLIVYRSGDRIDVLVARTDIPIGKVVGADDLTTARVATEGGGLVVAAGMREQYIGSTATSFVPAGTLLSSRMFTVTGVLPAGSVEVGFNVPSSQRPGNDVASGDAIALYFISGRVASRSTAGTDTAAIGAGDQLLAAARVVSVDKAGNGDTAALTILVKSDTKYFKDIVVAAAASQISIVKLPKSTPVEAEVQLPSAK